MKWQGRPVTVTTAEIKLDVAIDGVLVGHIENAVFNFFSWWLVEGGGGGWERSRAEAQRALIAAFDAGLKRWATPA